MKTVLITGGTGLIGRQLASQLRAKGYRVTLLSRTPKAHAEFTTYSWNHDTGFIDIRAIAEADYIIHLAGANLGEKRWTHKRQQAIVASRVKSGELLYHALKTEPHHVKAFISASAIGYYGAQTTETIFTETDPPATDFLGETCRKWEQVGEQIATLGIRTILLRTGVVLAPNEGALAKLRIPVALGIGSALGSGNQYVPWIHHDDICGMYLKALEDATMHGAYNAVAPTHTTNYELTKTLAHLLHKPFWFPRVPAFALRLLLGNMANMLLKGSRVSCQKISDAGYHFQFPELEAALKTLLRKKDKNVCVLEKRNTFVGNK